VTSSDSDVTSHRLLADQPEAVRQLVVAMMAEWHEARSSATCENSGAALQLDVIEVDGDLASSVMPQVYTHLPLMSV